MVAACKDKIYTYLKSIDEKEYKLIVNEFDDWKTLVKLEKIEYKEKIIAKTDGLMGQKMYCH